MTPGLMNSDSAPGVADLDHLLAVGPFSAALRAAIQASGLGLDRIRDRLRAGGTPVSLATLSYWQSGRHQPERPASLEALAGLEEILGVAPKSLTALVGSPRQRGQRIPGQLLDLTDIYQDNEAVLEALSRFSTDWSEDLYRVSHHDQVRIGRDKRMRGVQSRVVMRASADGPDRILVVYTTDAASDIAIRASRGCVLGDVFVSREAGLSVAELLFGRPLRRGEHVVVEYTVAFSAPFPPDMSWEYRVRKPIREYVLEIEFKSPQPPLRCVHFTSPLASFVETERVVALDGYGRALAVGLDLDPCRIGFRWEWSTQSTGRPPNR